MSIHSDLNDLAAALSARFPAVMPAPASCGGSWPDLLVASLSCGHAWPCHICTLLQLSVVKLNI